MPTGKIVLVVSVLDQGDILQDFIDWHLHIGVDLVVILDIGSTDGSRDLLDRLADEGKVIWFPLPERDMTKYDQGGELARLARDKYEADWIILCDADEFLCPVGDLGAILQAAASNEVTMIYVPVLNMTGPLLKPGQSAIEALTVRIDKPVTVTDEQAISGQIPVPYNFVGHAEHTIVRASAFTRYGQGGHYVEGSWGRSGDTDRLCFLHYHMRGYHEFEKKIRNTASWFRDNSHLDPKWSWHWRRWIRLLETGGLRADYESHFPSDELTDCLIRFQVCSRDETVANWARNRKRQE